MMAQWQARRRLSTWTSSPCLPTASAKSRIQESAILITPTKKEAKPPYTPRTSERGKDDFSKTEAELDSFFALHRRKKAVVNDLLSTGAAMKDALNSPDDSTDRPLARPSTKQRLQMRIDAARAEAANGRSPAEGVPKVPLTLTSDGTVCIDIPALQRRASDCPRGLGDVRPLTAKEVSRACKHKAEKMQRSRSAPIDYVKENRRSSSLKCLRPDILQRKRMELLHRRRPRADFAMERRRAETEVLRARAFSAAQLAKVATLKPAAIASSSAPVRLVPGSNPAESEAQAWPLSSEGARLGFRWAASEGFLGSIRCLLFDKRRERAWKLWDEALKLVVCKRFLKRLRSKRIAADIVKQALFQGGQVPFQYRLRNLYRQQKAAAYRLQRAWRTFAARIDRLVQVLLDGPWHTQETFLLEAIFSACPTEGEVIVNNLNLMTGTEGGDEYQDESVTMGNSRTEPASTYPRKKKKKSATMAAMSLSTTLLPKSSLLNESVNEASMRRVETMPSGLGACNRRSSQLRTLGPGGFSAASTLDIFSSGRQTAPSSKGKRIGSDAERAHQKELQQLLGGAMRRRLRKRVQAHRFRREVGAQLLRRELVERLYDYRTQAEIAKRLRRRAITRESLSMAATSSDPIRASFDALWHSEAEQDEDSSSSAAGSCARSVNDVGMVTAMMASAATRIDDAEVVELVFCLHYGHGVRPSHSGVCSNFYHACQDQKVKVIGETLSGTRTIRESLLDREKVRREALVDSTSVVSSRRHQQQRPASAPAGGSASASDATFGVASKEASGRPNTAVSSLRVQSKSFDDCFAEAEAFCRKVLESELEEECAEFDGPEGETGLRHLLPPGLAALEVGDLPGLHAAGMDLDAEKKQAGKAKATPAPQPADDSSRRGGARHGRRRSVCRWR